MVLTSDLHHCSAQAHSLDEMLWGRFLVGLGIGLNTVLVPLYISEVIFHNDDETKLVAIYWNFWHHEYLTSEIKISFANSARNILSIFVLRIYFNSYVIVPLCLVADYCTIFSFQPSWTWFQVPLCPSSQSIFSCYWHWIYKISYTVSILTPYI